MTIDDAEVPPCPMCGGMVVLVHVPHDGLVAWCTECEETFEFRRWH